MMTYKKYGYNIDGTPYCDPVAEMRERQREILDEYTEDLDVCDMTHYHIELDGPPEELDHTHLIMFEPDHKEGIEDSNGRITIVTPIPVEWRRMAEMNGSWHQSIEKNKKRNLERYNAYKDVPGKWIIMKP